MNNCLKIEVSIPEGIEQLDFQQYAFNNEITKVILPKSLKSIGRECFRCCNNLRFVEFNKYFDRNGIYDDQWSHVAFQDNA